ncbi:MAG: septal ring lytic transglycosylase RlpA family protein [Chitinophagales bacterium]|nr:septal ring lytic transglycosylase RlpA family protein [Chitinophagales bacterium]MDW8393100.1 septal ring lytic transglycosylase RlpA family protein [Chitinophagales bacterium]
MKRLTIALALLLAGNASLAQYRATGKASFYAKKFDGRLTANGEVFSNRELTAAHRTLPFGTWVRVTNLSNGRQVTVRINDRGPFIRNRIIDLSQAAADSLDFRRQGLTMVLVEQIDPPVPDTPSPATPEPEPLVWQPELWSGLWEGTLHVYDRNGFVQQVAMALHVAPADVADRYRWHISYAGEVRPYHLVLVDDSAGQCAIDENQGVLLMGRCLPRHLHFRFAVEGHLLDCTYDLLGDSTLLFAMDSGPSEHTWITGMASATDGGRVLVYDISHIQRAVLYRRPTH